MYMALTYIRLSFTICWLYPFLSCRVHHRKLGIKSKAKILVVTHNQSILILGSTEEPLITMLYFELIETGRYWIKDGKIVTFKQKITSLICIASLTGGNLKYYLSSDTPCLGFVRYFHVIVQVWRINCTFSHGIGICIEFIFLGSDTEGYQNVYAHT